LPGSENDPRVTECPPSGASPDLRNGTSHVWTRNSWVEQVPRCTRIRLGGSVDGEPAPRSATTADSSLSESRPSRTSPVSFSGKQERRSQRRGATIQAGQIPGGPEPPQTPPATHRNLPGAAATRAPGPLPRFIPWGHRGGAPAIRAATSPTPGTKHDGEDDGGGRAEARTYRVRVHDGFRVAGGHFRRVPGRARSYSRRGGDQTPTLAFPTSADPALSVGHLLTLRGPPAGQEVGIRNVRIVMPPERGVARRTSNVLLGCLGCLGFRVALSRSTCRWKLGTTKSHLSWLFAATEAPDWSWLFAATSPDLSCLYLAATSPDWFVA